MKMRKPMLKAPVRAPRGLFPISINVEYGFISLGYWEQISELYSVELWGRLHYNTYVSIFPLNLRLQYNVFWIGTLQAKPK